MEQLSRAFAEFDAHHVDGSRIRCHRSHGHHFTVTAEKIVAGEDLEADLQSIVVEWQDRSVNEMLHVTTVSLEGMAAWVNERLLLRHPTLVRVEVSDGRAVGIVRQEPRR